MQGLEYRFFWLTPGELREVQFVFFMIESGREKEIKNEPEYMEWRELISLFYEIADIKKVNYEGRHYYIVTWKYLLTAGGILDQDQEIWSIMNQLRLLYPTWEDYA